jgi:hypothetical protein
MHRCSIIVRGGGLCVLLAVVMVGFWTKQLLDCAAKKLGETSVIYNYSSPKWSVEYSEL